MPPRKTTAAAPRTVGREDSFEERTPERMPERDQPLDRVDPNAPILTRSGRPATIRMTGDEDKFDLERLGIYPPNGWTYEWKTKTVKGWEWTDHQVELYQNGWEPVPASRHDGLVMPKGHDGNIERGGLILMERDDRLTARARKAEKRSADVPLNNSRSMAGLMAQQLPAGAEMVEFEHSQARGATGVKGTREVRVAQRNYQYSVDE